MAEKNTAPIEPLGDRILVVKEDSETTSAGGIIIPDVAKEPSQIAVVKAVGPGVQQEDGTFRPLNVKAGDRVFVGRYAGVEATIDGVTYQLLRENDCLGRVVE